MEQDFFEKHYPQISKLYSVYTSEKRNNAIIQATEEYTGQLLKKQKTYTSKGIILKHYLMHRLLLWNMEQYITKVVLF